jgi:lipopolysaccharide transport system ATP-binding protein
MTSSIPSKIFPGAIQVEQLGKCYKIRRESEPAHLKFNELVAYQFSRLFGSRRGRTERRHFWALRDVSFAINPGELVGLVGRNGSGKSTLLKLLAQVIKPTAGRALLRGRVGSLLEVGTGFHPELTGHENIYLSGAIRGMNRAEIAAKFDAIVAFADIGPFLQLPIKRVSSGMAMRLAFSVAAHLNPDILLVDEALSIGDVAFQKKCLDRMESFVAGGATVIFVTHDLALVKKWCKRLLLLDGGRLVADGPSSTVLGRYLETVSPGVRYRVEFSENQTAATTGLSLRELIVNDSEPIRHGAPCRFAVTLATTSRQQRISFSLALSDLEGTRLVSCDSDLPGPRLDLEAGRRYTISAALPRLDLIPGTYLLDVGIRHDDGLLLDHRPGCLRLEVLPPAGDGVHPGSLGESGTRPPCDWRVEPA